MKKGKILGKGSFSIVYENIDNQYTVIKKTKDVATKNFIKEIYKKKYLNFVKVLEINKDNIEIEKLNKIKNKELINNLKDLYRDCLKISVEKILIKYDMNHLDNKFLTANSLAVKNKKYSHELSILILKEMQKKCLNNEHGKKMRKSLSFLEKFIKKYNYDIDLLHIDNWMINSNNQLILSDPIVKRAWEFKR